MITENSKGFAIQTLDYQHDQLGLLQITQLGNTHRFVDTSAILGPKSFGFSASFNVRLRNALITR